jgi:hypothetical protein
VALYRTQMTQYAKAQVARAQLVLDAHRPDGTGCCRSCGRPAPCPDRGEAQLLHDRYTGWLSTDPNPMVGAHRYTVSGRLVRPYVTNLGPR